MSTGAPWPAGWPSHPVVLEIHTWAWLEGLARRLGRPVSLGSVPGEVWDETAAGLDALWLMGVWERSEASRRIAAAHPGVVEECRRALPDFRPEDIVGSPYSVHRYVVDDRLGGEAGLAAARRALRERGVRLLLDFIPNHVAVDHPTVAAHPSFLVTTSPARARRDPLSFFTAGGRAVAHGRDPYLPAWTDTAQLNAFHPGLRRTAAGVLGEIASRCDGARCDMAMLMLTGVFSRTWGDLAGAPPAREYWSDVIGEVRREHPGFLLLAEAYWDTEEELLGLGFDCCYDKDYYDALVRGDAATARALLQRDPALQARLARFIENHDEARAAAVFPPEGLRAAAVAAATLPGPRLLHEGQRGGRRVKLPVQLGRRPDEEDDAALGEFYRRLLGELAAPLFHEGEWALCEPGGWPDNQSCRRLLAWAWRLGEERCLVAVNLAGDSSQGLVPLPWEDVAGGEWLFSDPLSGDAYRREGDATAREGLFVDLPAWGAHFFRVERP